MRKKAANIGSIIGAFLGGLLVAYAITSFFTSGNLISNLKPKPIFETKLSAGEMNAEIGPGESFSTSPVVYNDATEEISAVF